MLIIPNCFIEGISARYVPTTGAAATATGTDADGKPTNIDGVNYVEGKFQREGGTDEIAYGVPDKDNLTVRVYDAATFKEDGTMITPNNGPLGNLDRPVGGLGSITAGIVVRKMD